VHLAKGFYHRRHSTLTCSGLKRLTGPALLKRAHATDIKHDI